MKCQIEEISSQLLRNFKTTQRKKNICFIYLKFIYIECIKLLLTEREGRKGEYWPEVVTVRTDQAQRGPHCYDLRPIFPSTVPSK